MEKQLLTECRAAKLKCFDKGIRNTRQQNSNATNARMQRIEEAIKKDKMSAHQKLEVTKAESEIKLNMTKMITELEVARRSSSRGSKQAFDNQIKQIKAEAKDAILQLKGHNPDIKAKAPSTTSAAKAKAPPSKTAAVAAKAKAPSKTTAAKAPVKAKTPKVKLHCKNNEICFAETPNKHLKNKCLQKVGSQMGSNPGGVYQAGGSNKQFYIKTADDATINSQNHVEALAGSLYHAAGVRVAKVDLLEPVCINIDGKDVGNYSVLVSEMENVEDIHVRAMTQLKGLKEGFLIDAWLANWDVIGNYPLTSLNVKDLNGHAFRLDTGGTLFYRATGGPKGSAWNDNVDELVSMRSIGNAGEIFVDVTTKEFAAGQKHLKRVTESTIRKLSNRYLTGSLATDTADRLIARRKKLLSYTPAELKKIK